MLAGLEIEVGSVPAFLWSKMMRGWIFYVPKRKKSHFQEYKKTQLSRKFFKSFPMVRRDKTVAPDLVMRITVSAQTVARAMYDFQGERMILTFWYVIAIIRMIICTLFWELVLKNKYYVKTRTATWL